MKKPRRKGSKTEDYILLSIPENEGLFAVQRRTEGSEKFVKADPEGKLLGPVYDGVTYLVSPTINYETGRAGESCTCLSWRTRRRRCVHLRKFYEMNPEAQKPDIYEDTCLHPLVLADGVCDLLQKSYIPNLKDLLSRQLEERACEKYREEESFREQLAACRNIKPKPGSPESARDWLTSQMMEWAQSSGIKP